MQRLIRISQISLPQPSTFVIHTFLNKNFGNISKKEKVLKDSKDFSINQRVNIKLDALRLDIQKQDEDDFQELSKLAELDRNSEEFKRAKLYPEFHPDKKKISKILKREYNKKIDSVVKSSADLFEADILRDSLPSSKENLRKIEEMNLFKKLEFKKRETKRLVEREKIKAENYLPGAAPALNISYDQYKNNIDELKNRRIDNFLNRFNSNNENKKLSLLLQSGLMDKSVNIEKLIDNSLEALHQEKRQGKFDDKFPQDIVYPEIQHQAEGQAENTQKK